MKISIRKKIIVESEIEEFSSFATNRLYCISTQYSEARARSSKSLGFRFVVLSGPPGVGKSTLLPFLANHRSGGINWKVLRRVTTRLRRSSDSNEELRFVNEHEYAEMERTGSLCCSEHYAGSHSKYGISAHDVRESLKNSSPNTVHVVVGTLALIRILPRSGYMYLMPPSLGELQRRILGSDKTHKEVLYKYGVREMDAFLSIFGGGLLPLRIGAAFFDFENGMEPCADTVADFAKGMRTYLGLPSGAIKKLA